MLDVVVVNRNESIPDLGGNAGGAALFDLNPDPMIKGPRF